MTVRTHIAQQRCDSIRVRRQSGPRRRHVLETPPVRFRATDLHRRCAPDLSAGGGAPPPPPGPPPPAPAAAPGRPPPAARRPPAASGGAPHGNDRAWAGPAVRVRIRAPPPRRHGRPAGRERGSVTRL